MMGKSVSHNAGARGVSVRAVPDRCAERIVLARYRMVEQLVARVFRVAFSDLRAPTRCRARVAFARQVTMYLAHVACGLSVNQVARLCGRDRTTTAHACRLVEDRRDDPALDSSLTFLELVLKSWMSARREPLCDAGVDVR